MDKITLSDVLSGYSLQRINDNFSKIEDAINNNVLGNTGDVLLGDLDVNGKRLYNPPAPTEDSHPARLKDVSNAIAGIGGYTANLINFVPQNGVTATNVQGAVEEVMRRAKLQVSVTDLGADPTGATDSSGAFQQAVDSYKNVYVPAGTYLVNTPVNVTTDVSIRGEKRKSIIKKTSTGTNSVTRTYVDNNGVTQTLTWNNPVVFNLVCPTNSYLIDFQIDNITFNLPSDGSVGVFHAQRVAHSSFTNLFCNTSLFFIKGFDMWQIDWRQIRSRFSKDHFNIDTGTSNTFTNVSCDTKYSAGGNGYTFSNLNYTVMNGCSCDSVDRAYYFNNSTVTLNGCGSESFSRLLHVVNGARVTVNGGSLATYKSGSATGSFIPYAIQDANTSVTFNNTWLGVANPAVSGGTYDSMSVTNGAKVFINNVRKPVEIGTTNWYYVADANSVLTLVDENGTKYINRYGASRLDGVTNQKNFEYTKTGVAAGSAQSIFRINNASYGQSCIGRIRVIFINSYADGMGFAGEQEYKFTCMKETTASQLLYKVSEAFVPSNSGGSALGAVTASLLRDGDNTVDFQLNIANSPAAVSVTNVIVMVDYFSFSGTNPSGEVMTGL